MKIEEVFEAVQNQKNGRHLNDLSAHFELLVNERSVLEQHLQVLIQYQLIEEIKSQVYRQSSEEIIGGITISSRGFGFVTPERFEAPNIFINPLDLSDARHRDRVSVTLYTAKDGRFRGKVTRILERGMQSCVGIIRRQDGEAWLSPQSEQLPPSIRLLASAQGALDLEQVAEGSLLAVSLLDEQNGEPLMAIPLHVINPNDPQGQLEAVIYNQGLQLALSTEVQSYAERFSNQISDEEYSRRRDLRHLPFITIDPNSAQDFDDALYVQPRKSENSETHTESSGWVLWVAIADVAHYVAHNDPIDLAAKQRSATLYLPAQAFPMLPHHLSNDLCSLKPKVDRLAMVARIEVNTRGDIEYATFHEAIIHSQARLTYDEAATVLGILPQQPLPKHIIRQKQNVTAIRDCARALKNRRRRRGFLNLDLIEPRLNFDIQGMIDGFKVAPRHEAHEMVEEAMLAANESVAMHCIKENIPALYRVHAPPPERGVERFEQQAQLLGAPLESKKKLKAHQLSKYLRLHTEHPRSELLSSLLLRAMSKAAYHAQPALHYGLGTNTYVHFTSPIRRYPDLWVHRQLKAWLNEQSSDQHDAVEVAGYASRRERLIMEAERKVLDAYKALYMREHIGQVYKGVVCQTSPKGFLVDLYDYPIWCSHSVDKLPGSFRYDEQLYMWQDVIQRRKICLGSEVEVRIISSDVSLGRVEVIITDI